MKKILSYHSNLFLDKKNKNVKFTHFTINIQDPSKILKIFEQKLYLKKIWKIWLDCYSLNNNYINFYQIWSKCQYLRKIMHYSNLMYEEEYKLSIIYLIYVSWQEKQKREIYTFYDKQSRSIKNSENFLTKTSFEKNMTQLSDSLNNNYVNFYQIWSNQELIQYLHKIMHYRNLITYFLFFNLSLLLLKDAFVKFTSSIIKSINIYVYIIMDIGLDMLV